MEFDRRKGKAMRRLAMTFVAVLLCGLAGGCSERTVEKSKDAAEATGEAVGSAVHDAAEATKDAAESVEKATDDQ
jgi:hypothetical protein